MNNPTRSGPPAPVGTLVLIALMYVPWLFYFIPRRPLGPGESHFEFPDGLLLGCFGFIYLNAAIALPFLLYRRREASRAHAIAYYASLGILALFTTLIWSGS